MKIVLIFLVLPFAFVAPQGRPAEPIPIEPEPLPIRPGPIPLPGPLPEEDDRELPKKPFLAVSSGIIRPEFKFNFALYRIDKNACRGRLHLEAALLRDDGENIEVVSEKDVTFRWCQREKILSLDVSDFARGSYSLRIREVKRRRPKRKNPRSSRPKKHLIKYEEIETLVYASKEESLLLQLEKGIYSPGQTVRFRVYAVNVLTNSINPDQETCTASIKDSNNNLIEEYANLYFENGKYENELKLGEGAPNGRWSVQVTCGRENVFKSFEIAEYELPLYEVIVNIPSRVSFSDGTIPVQITAKYTFGDPVEGNATFEISNFRETLLVRELTLNNGEASFELDIENDLDAVSDGFRSYNYAVTVRDSVLSLEETERGRFSITPYKYQVLFDASRFLPTSSDYEFEILVNDFDNIPAPEGKAVLVKIEIYYNDRSREIEVVESVFYLDRNGRAFVSIYIDEDVRRIRIQVSSDLTSNGFWFASTLSGSPGSISIFSEEDTIDINKRYDVKVFVDDDDVDWFIYFISAKGVLLKSDLVYFRRRSNTAYIRLLPDIRYFPKFIITAVYLKGVDFVTTTKFMTVNGLNNYVELSFDDIVVAPGSTQAFSVESKCGSTVSLSFIDQRVLLLKDEAGISYNEVVSAVRPFDFEFLPFPGRGYIPPYERSFLNAKLRPFSNIPPPVFKDFPLFAEDEAQRRESKSAGSPDDEVAIRTDFRENFCWIDVDVNQRACPAIYRYYPLSWIEWILAPLRRHHHTNVCRAEVECQVPESITKYIAYSVAMNPHYGIGVTDIPSSITTFLPFFLVWEPPYSLKRNEVLILDIALFNSISEGQNVVFRITKTGKFDGVDLNTYGWTESAEYFEKSYYLEASENYKLQFALVFNFIGIFDVEITARGPLAGDGISRPIRVIFEGVERIITKSVLITENQPNITNLACDFPEGVIEGSKDISATVIGDMLAKALKNLDRLIRLPRGCGEQTLISLAPNIAVYEYLFITGKLTSALDTKITEFTKSGIQNQLGFIRKDGSISAFGSRDPSGSIWLSMATAITFLRASRIEGVTVDQNVISGLVAFVLNNQDSAGFFTEPGRVIHVDMQGGTSSGLGMTAYMAIALVEFYIAYPDRAEYKAALDLAIPYLIDQSENLEDVYELAIITHALILYDIEFSTELSTSTSELFNKFFNKKMETDTEIFWEKTTEPEGGSYYSRPLSLDIEIASYALMSLILLEEGLPNAVKVAKYLTAQANDLGGYGSTQDTVKALEALARFAEGFSTSGANVGVTLSPDVGASFYAEVNSGNSMTLQQFELDADVTTLTVEPDLSSNGLAIVSLICRFYQDPAAVEPSFNISAQYTSGCPYFFRMRVCVKYIPRDGRTRSNMAVATFYCPSGYQYRNWFRSVNDKEITKIETFNSNTKINFYFNKIGEEEACFDVNAYRGLTVANLKGGSITVFDFYDTSKEGSTSFEAPPTSGSCF